MTGLPRYLHQLKQKQSNKLFYTPNWCVISELNIIKIISINIKCIKVIL